MCKKIIADIKKQVKMNYNQFYGGESRWRKREQRKRKRKQSKRASTKGSIMSKGKSVKKRCVIKTVLTVFTQIVFYKGGGGSEA